MYIWWALNGATTTVCSILCTFIMEMKCNISFTLVLMSIALSRSLVFVLKDNTKQCFFLFLQTTLLTLYIHVMCICMCVIAERISARLCMRDLFSQCAYVRTYVRTHVHSMCLSRSWMSICPNVHARRGTHMSRMCTDTGEYIPDA